MAKTENLYPDETYTVELPLNDEHEEDVFVSVNGHNYMIRRGEPVEVPGSVYEVLMNSQKMDSLAIRRRQAKYKKA